MDTAGLLLRVALSLGAVLGLVWLLARGARRTGAGRFAPASRFTVVGRQSLGRSAGVAVVRVGDRALVLGVTEQSVRLLAETDLSAVLEEPSAPEHRTQLDLSGAGAASTALTPDLLRPDLLVSSGLAREALRPGPAPRPASPLEGSALSPQTWSRALEALRERTTRG